MSLHPDTARLKRFYALYAPEKTDSDIKATLDKFGGSDEMLVKMWNGLVKKYGPEPPAPPEGGGGGGGGGGVHPDTDRLRRFYAKYAPEKTDADVKATLDKFGGTPEMTVKMWNGLVKKYGPEPESAAVAPSSFPSPAAAAAGSVGPPGTVYTAADVTRLSRMYKFYAPEKSDSDVKATLDKFGTSDAQLQKMWSSLVKKYGPEPAGGDAPAQQASLQPQQQQQQAGGLPGVCTQADVDRLRAIYGHYAPEKTEVDVMATLAKYGDKRETLDKMWNGLVKKYGPEPNSAASYASQQQQQQPFASNSNPPSPTPIVVDAAPQQQQGAQSPFVAAAEVALRSLTPQPQQPQPQEGEAAPRSRFVEATPPVVTANPPQQFAPPQQPQQPAAQSQQQQQQPSSLAEQIQKRMKRIFLKYEPALANDADVEDMYNKYEHAAGGHKAMLQELRARYGPEPAADEYLPEPSAAVPSSLKRRGGHNDSSIVGGISDRSVIDIESSPLKAAIDRSRMETMLHSSSGVGAAGSGGVASPGGRPSRFLPSVKPPASLIDETITSKRRAEAMKRTELDMRHRIVCSQMSIRLFGAEYHLYDMASMEAQKKFRTAVEIDIGLHLRVAPKFIRVVGVAPGSIIVDVDVDVPEDERLVKEASSPNLDPFERALMQERRSKDFEVKEASMKLLLDELADAILCGRFRLTNTRASYRDNLGGNPVAVYAQSIVLDGVNVADFKREQQSQSSRFPGSSLVVSLNPSAAAAQQRALLLAQFNNNPNHPQYQEELEKLLLWQREQQQAQAAAGGGQPQFGGIPGGLASGIEASPLRSDEVVVLGQAGLDAVGVNASYGIAGSQMAAAGHNIEHSHFGLMDGATNRQQPTNSRSIGGGGNEGGAANNNKLQAPNFLDQLWFDPNVANPNANRAAASSTPNKSVGGDPPSRYDFYAANAKENAAMYGDGDGAGDHGAARGGGGGGGGGDRDRHIDNLMAAIHRVDSGVDPHLRPNSTPIPNVKRVDSSNGAAVGRMPSSVGGVGGGAGPIMPTTTFTLEELQRLGPEGLARILQPAQQQRAAPPPAAAQSTISPATNGGGAAEAGGGAPMNRTISSRSTNNSVTALNRSNVVDNNGNQWPQPHSTNSGEPSDVDDLYARLRQQQQRLQPPTASASATPPIVAEPPHGDTNNTTTTVSNTAHTAAVQTSLPPTPPSASLAPRIAEQQLQLQAQNSEFFQQQSAQQTAILEMIANMQKQQQEMQLQHQRQREEQAEELLRQQKAQEAQLAMQMAQQQQQFQAYQQQLMQYQQYQQHMLLAAQQQNALALNATSAKAEALQGQLNKSHVEQRLLHQQYQQAYTDHYAVEGTDGGGQGGAAVGLAAMGLGGAGAAAEGGGGGGGALPINTEDTRRHGLPDGSFQSNIQYGRGFDENGNRPQQQGSVPRAGGGGIGSSMNKNSNMLVPPSFAGYQFN